MSNGNAQSNGGVPSSLPSDYITVAEGTDRERVIQVVRPRGHQKRKHFAKHLPKVALLSQLEQAEGEGGMSQFEAMANVVQVLWEDDDFERELVPTLLDLNMKNKDDRLWFESLDVMDIFRAFTEAVSIVLTPENVEVLEEAQKK